MPEKTITIVFRGLMIFHQRGSVMEIGLVDARAPHHHADEAVGHAAGDDEVHIPRILEMRDGILVRIVDLRSFTDVLGSVRNWKIKVGNPKLSASDVAPPINFDRTKDPATLSLDEQKAFAWITDLEGNDMHRRALDADLDTRNFLFVLYVENGHFYTKLHSPKLKRKNVKPSKPDSNFGYAAAVTGCDIVFNDTGGRVTLMAGGDSGLEVFEFKPTDRTIYEISNSPPDVPVDDPMPIDAPGHFHMYYDKLFIQPPREQFDFTKDATMDGPSDPAPDPQLCGAAFLSQRTDPL